jgi:uncharacterized protein (TIGR03382 family)
VRVHGANLSEGAQAFALAVIGVAPEAAPAPRPVEAPEKEPSAVAVREARSGCAAGGSALPLFGFAAAVVAAVRRRRR